jgi:hypothetical protein
MRLYTYKMVVDQGAAPNPFHGSCTLAICKPAIRRTARPGDWIAGIGSKNLAYPNRLIYAMQVEQSLPIGDYYRLYPEKRPDWNSGIYEQQAGDNIYDLANPRKPRLLKSVHTSKDIVRDLSGLNVLVSKSFHYFGDQAPEIPEGLAFLTEVERGHRNSFSSSQVKYFLDWIGEYPSGINGSPINAGPFLICQ